MTGANANSRPDTQRLDKWLWAARLFKTRSLATTAIAGGKVHVEGQRVKASKQIADGVTLTVRKGPVELEIVVRGLSRQRGPAPEAALLYEETPASIAQRSEAAEQRRARNQERARGLGRPTKRDRRQINYLKGK